MDEAQSCFPAKVPKPQPKRKKLAMTHDVHCGRLSTEILGWLVFVQCKKRLTVPKSSAFAQYWRGLKLSHVPRLRHVACYEACWQYNRESEIVRPPHHFGSCSKNTHLVGLLMCTSNSIRCKQKAVQSSNDNGCSEAAEKLCPAMGYN